ncbi:hypothetical protein FF011L_12670 [Roseimaritima multifibrata]|uniref:Uncharacterized protein n=1 Tax=Roseimaritima multifibrata TaxID=1930274 RepID=A0A517MCA0_9BACT|nr:hypothetical protein FF011L_12670 [Roseimaritima multifibrata]
MKKVWLPSPLSELFGAEEISASSLRDLCLFFDLVKLAWGRGAGGEGEISRRRFCSEDAVNASDFMRLCHALPNAVGPSPPKQAFESYLIELAGEPLIQYQTCFKRACFEGEGSQTFLHLFFSRLGEARLRGSLSDSFWRSHSLIPNLGFGLAKLC